MVTVRLNNYRGTIDYTVEFAMLEPVVKHFGLNMLYWLWKGQSRPVTEPLSALRLSEGRRLRHEASAVSLTACHRKITERQKQSPLLFYTLVPKVYLSTIRHRFCYLLYISGWRIKWKYIMCTDIRVKVINKQFWEILDYHGSCLSVK